MISIDVNIMEQGWKTAIPGLSKLCDTIVHRASTVVSGEHNGDVSIALTNDAHMTTLNRDFRNQHKPTNVLSFPDAGPAPILGDIAISLETVRTEANEQGKTLVDHFTHMLVHGFLHLLGYDHVSDAEADIMESLEIKILSAMNIDNPYVTHEFDKT